MMPSLRRYIVITALVPLVGCFDSLVSGDCASGYAMEEGHCHLDIGTDGGTGPDARPRDGGTDDGAMPDALVCSLPEVACGASCSDPASDPDNCGTCGRVCGSGICQSSACVGELAGHIVAIGHDYRSQDPAMARVLGNALGLGPNNTIRVGFYQGTADEATWTGVVTAAKAGLSAIGRNHTESFPSAITDANIKGLDALVIEAQIGDGDMLDTLGASWTLPLDNFFGRGGVVVVLEGLAGTSYRAAHGAGLYDVVAPVDATSQQVTVASPTDAVAQGVPSPYLARSTSVAYPGIAGVVVNAAGDAVVFHTTK